MALQELGLVTRICSVMMKKNEGYKDLGNPQFILKAPGIEQGIEWRGFQLRTIAASEDGKYIVMGEDEALSQLLIFQVGN